MISFERVPSLHLPGNLQIHPFGLLVATGVLLGAWLIHRRARTMGIPREEIDGIIHWAVVPGFIGAHLIEILFYQFHRLENEGPLLLLKFWDGISSYGGFIGAMVGVLLYYRTRLTRGFFVYCDLLVEGLLLGWIFGRVGCTITMDHPGEITDFPLAFQQGGVARHNLGFYELIFTVLVLFPAAQLVRRRMTAGKLAPGHLTAVICLLYAPVRFFLDLLRATDRAGSDTRYLGLTFAHYASLALGAFAVWLLVKLRSERGVASAQQVLGPR